MERLGLDDDVCICWAWAALSVIEMVAFGPVPVMAGATSYRWDPFVLEHLEGVNLIIEEINSI